MQKSRKSSIIIVFVLIFFNFIIYFNAINSEFVGDDIELLKDNHYIRDVNNIKTLLTQEDSFAAASTGYYRPIISLSYLLDYQIYGGEPYGYRLTNIALSTLCSIMLFFLIVLITGDRLLALVTSIIFSAQAVHYEAVSFIAGRNNVFCTLFILLSIYFYVKNVKQHRLSSFFYSMLFLFLGAASKEFAFLVPLIFILYDYSYDTDFSVTKNIKKYAAGFMTVALFLAIKSLVISSSGSAMTLEMETLYQRVITTLPIMVSYLRMQVVPYGLTLFYDLPLKVSLFDPTVLFSMMFLIAISYAVFLYKNKMRALFFFFFTYVILLIPIANVISIPAPTLMANRWIYPASFAFAFVLAQLLILLFKKRRTALVVVSILITAELSFFMIKANRVLSNEMSLYTDILEKAPGSFIAVRKLGNVYARQGDYDEAAKYYLQAVELKPDFFMNYHNLGYVYASKKDFNEALKYYKKAYKLNPKYLYTLLNLASTYRTLGDLDESNRYYDESIAFNAQFYPAYLDLAYNYYKQGRYEEAIAKLSVVKDSSPNRELKMRADALLKKISDTPSPK